MCCEEWCQYWAVSAEVRVKVPAHFCTKGVHSWTPWQGYDRIKVVNSVSRLESFGRRQGEDARVVSVRYAVMEKEDSI